MGVTKVKGIDVRDGSITESDIVLSLTETLLDVSDEFVVKDSTSGLLKRASVSVVETYLNIKYQAKSSDLAAIAAISGTSGLLKKTAAGAWSLDTSSYLTAITKAQVESVLTGEIASHTHNYATVSQVHYIGTTSIAANRASAAQTLTGTSIDGNAATVGNKGISNILASKDQLVSGSNLNLIYEIGAYLNTTGNGTGNSNWPDGYGVLNVFGYNNTQTYGNVQQYFTSPWCPKV